MTRHSKNNTDGAVFTSHEKRRAGFGSRRARLDADYVVDFDCCRLSLRPCREPVVSKISADGYLFEKEYIYENLLKQKKALRASARERELARHNEQLGKREREEHERQRDTQRFEAIDGGVSVDRRSESAAEKAGVASTTRVTSHGVDVTGALQNNFWLPSNTPRAAAGGGADNGGGKNSAAAADAPADLVTRNPISHRKLRAKELIPVHFSVATKAADTAGGGGGGGGGGTSFVCAVCQQPLHSALRCVVLRPRGDVLCGECVRRFVLPERRDPLSGAPLDIVHDVIRIRTDAGAQRRDPHGAVPVAVKYEPAMRS